MRVCLATTEILGAHRNGGIGTATSHLAILLANAGHSVTLLYGGEDPLEIGSLWHGIYHRFDVSVVRVKPRERELEPWALRHPVTFFEYLRGSSFDLIMFQDWLGLGQACVLAKRNGMAFADCHLAVNAHGNVEWALAAADKQAETRDQLLQVETERQSIEFADTVISPSTYLVDWMREQNWHLPTQTLVIQNYLLGLRLAGAECIGRRRTQTPERHLVFFGRLEARKGIYLFLDALRAPALRGKQFELSFLGKESDLRQDQIIAWLGEYRPDLLPVARFLNNKNEREAIEYLQVSGGLALIPSLTDNSPCVVWECIENGIPFIATRTGGIPELVADEVQDEILVAAEPDALAQRIGVMLECPSWPNVAHKQSPVDVGRRWLDFFEAVAVGSSAASGSRVATNDDGDRITFLLLDLSDKSALDARLQELFLQTCSQFETIIISDKTLDATLTGQIAKKLGVTWEMPRSSGLLAALFAGAKAATSELLIIGSTVSALSPDCVGAFRKSLIAFPQAVVTGQLIRTQPHANAFRSMESSRQGFLGGPLCLGAFENCFGCFPFAIRRDVLLAAVPRDSAVSDIWPLLTTCALAGHRVLSLPIAVATEPQISNEPSFWTAAQNHREFVRRLYRSRLPESLRSLAHFGRP
jgi:O-antigen biosynthesis protein